MNALHFLAAAALASPGPMAGPDSQPPLMSAQLSPQWATDMSGLWIVSTTLDGRPVTIDCNVLQVGIELYGSCEPEAQGAVPVALRGRIDGAQASWAYEVQGQGATAQLQYRATVASNMALNGTLTYAGAPAGFTARRR